MEFNIYEYDDNLIRIDIPHGSFSISELNLKIAKLYDFDLILNAVENKMIEMKKTNQLNTGVISLPCGFTLNDVYFNIRGIGGYIGRKIENLSYDSSTAHINLSRIGYYGDESISNREYGKRLFDLKKELTKHKCSNIFVADEEIDWERCFDNNSPDTLYSLFSQMQKNFSWMDINNMIYVHSLFGQAYTNAVQRVSEYKNSELVCLNIPESSIVYEEFRKILKKYYFHGYKIKHNIFVVYVNEYLNRTTSM